MSKTFLRALAVALVAAGCGLISSDVTQVKLRFPRHDFRIDSADWGIAAGGQVPSIPCAVGCQASGPLLCGASSCAPECDTATSTCQLRVGITLKNDVDLAKEAPEFAQIAAQPVISVTVDAIYFDISENTLTTATPALSVYFGPTTIVAPSDAGAELVGVIDPVPSRTTGRVDVRFQGNGQQTMKKFMDDFHTPFRVLIAGQLVIGAGDEVPAGRLVGSVQGEAHAGL